ncbi:MAG: DUF4167 domain-containing protein [Alphaproteobacteria bacterium]|nr:DUF4167 domain-containing protein [Alphaproteobacteria bacterium]
MKQDSNGRNRSYGRGFNSKKQTLTKNTVVESSGPAGKVRGNLSQIYDKYMVLGKEAAIQNNRVLAETFYQFADHYHRLFLMAEENIRKGQNSVKDNRHFSSNQDTSSLEKKNSETTPSIPDEPASRKETENSSFVAPSIESFPEKEEKQSSPKKRGRPPKKEK